MIITTRLPNQFINDNWVIDLREPSKWRKIMNFFKRKEANVRFMSPWCERNEYPMTEKEYVDINFKGLKKQIDFLIERVDMLEETNETKRIFISSHGGYLGKDRKWMNYKEAREWADENNYKYVKFFERYGELWIKEEKDNGKTKK